VAQTLGRDLQRDADLFAAMVEIHCRGASWVVVTNGKEPLHALSSDGLFRIDPPTCEVVNPIGCGDCMAGAIAWALASGRNPLEALRYGAAAAADKAGQLLPGLIDRARVEALAPSIRIERLMVAT
jgi:fructose-1-phosphate kinase PfkB-like protein